MKPSIGVVCVPYDLGMRLLINHRLSSSEYNWNFTLLKLEKQMKGNAFSQGEIMDISVF